MAGSTRALRSFELLDFWASAIERGFRGRHPRRAAAQLPRATRLGLPAFDSAGHLPRSARSTSTPSIAARSSVTRLELIDAKEAFLVSQRDYRRTLESRTASLEAELRALRQEIADTARGARHRGLSRVEWGDLRRRSRSASTGAAIAGSRSTGTTSKVSRRIAPTCGAAFSRSATPILHAAIRRRRGHLLRRRRSSMRTTARDDHRRPARRRRHSAVDLRLHHPDPDAALDRRHAGRARRVRAHPPPGRRPAGDGAELIRVDDESGRTATSGG